ncbi:MAG: response regulator [Coriobacteriia bacterium]|jgi:CheY-like chemotaxis protein|nr:response regulator [Coriobacteriia bacterium]
MAGETILIADDNRQIRMLVTASLRTGGYVLIEAENGEIALEKAIANHPDLVLLDVTMPKLDGFEVLHFLHKRPDTADVKVVMLTTASTKEDIQTGYSEGAVDYLVKPFEPARLREAVDKALHG